MNEDRETETLGSVAEVAAAGEDDQEGETFRPERSKVVTRIALLKQRGIEVDEWIAEEFTGIERQLAQLRDAVQKRRQPIVWFQTAKEVLEALDRGVVKDKNEARKLLGLTGRVAKRRQPEGLRRHAEARRAGRS